jgi:hypothetical protein
MAIGVHRQVCDMNRFTRLKHAMPAAFQKQL